MLNTLRSYLVKKGLIRADVPFGVELFQLKPEYFPEVTRTLFPTALMLKHGALPLGFKSVPGFLGAAQFLNLGFLDPTNEEAVSVMTEAAKAKLGKSCSGVHSYLVQPEAFVQVLSHAYHLKKESLHQLPPQDLSPALHQFLSAT